MKKKSLESAIALAAELSSPIANCVTDSVEVGVIVPSVLTAKLRAAGYAVNFKAGDKHGAWVLVTRDDATAYDSANPNIVARAFSHDEPDALLQAVFAAMKEECSRG